MVSTVDETGVTSTFSGDVRIEFANFSISGGMVAEKKVSAAYRESVSITRFISCIKPISNIRSASSSTNNRAL